MGQFDLGILVESVVGRFNSNRTGHKPAVLTMFPRDLSPILWPDETLETFLKRFICDVLLMSNPETMVCIAAAPRSMLKGLENETGRLCWIQLTVRCDGPRNLDNFVRERFGKLSVRARIEKGTPGICPSTSKPFREREPKLVLHIDNSDNQSDYHLLIPVQEKPPLNASSGILGYSRPDF
jgi:hypothetical protein